MILHAVVPVKALAGAKSRLAGALAPPARRELVLAMLERVLATLAACREPAAALCAAGGGPPTRCEAPPGVAATWVVSGDPEVLALAAARGARPLLEAAPGLNGALEQARRAAMAAGAEALLVLPADVPLAAPEDVAALAAALAAGADVALAPDHAGSGTNAMALWLSAGLRFAFGEGSFTRHLAAARWDGLIVEVVSSPRLALDIDTPDGLAAYRRAAS